MAFLNSLNISGSGLTAQKLRMDVISQNIANANTSKTEDGEPFRRKMTVFRSKDADFSSLLKKASGDEDGGVAVEEIVDDQRELKAVYDPSNPDADENGYVMMPNISTVEEMIDMMSASRSYEANVTAFNAVKQMASTALQIGK